MARRLVGRYDEEFTSCFASRCGASPDGETVVGTKHMEAGRQVAPAPGPAAGGVLGALRTFAFTPNAPAAARHFAVATVGRWGAGDLSEDVALVVTELAANAVRHARSAFTVILSFRRHMMR